jgi:hypothetical protein
LIACVIDLNTLRNRASLLERVVFRTPSLDVLRTMPRSRAWLSIGTPQVGTTLTDATIVETANASGDNTIRFGHGTCYGELDVIDLAAWRTGPDWQSSRRSS